jgi:predicted cation transporter
MRYIFSILFFFGIITVYAQDTIVLKEITVEDNYTKNINKIIVDSITQQIHHQNSLGDLLSYEPGII